jgi:hypothetical protein
MIVGGLHQGAIGTPAEFRAMLGAFSGNWNKNAFNGAGSVKSVALIEYFSEEDLL